MSLATVIRDTAANPTHSIIWLHGLGADGNDFAPIVPELVDARTPPLRFVFPHAPVRPVTVNNGVPMRAWYDILAFDLNALQDIKGIRESISAVESLIAAEKARGIPTKQIVLGGFSQGGAIALAAGLRHDEPLAGIVALSTYLPLADTLAKERSEANTAIPLFWGHGTADPIVSLERGELSRRWLEQAGYVVDWHTYPMAHQVCPAELDDLREWLANTFAPHRDD